MKAVSNLFYWAIFPFSLVEGFNIRYYKQEAVEEAFASERCVAVLYSISAPVF